MEIFVQKPPTRHMYCYQMINDARYHRLARQVLVRLLVFCEGAEKGGVGRITSPPPNEAMFFLQL